MNLGLSLALVSGCVLNIPRMINEGALVEPAVQYTDEVVDAILRIFRSAD